MHSQRTILGLIDRIYGAIENPTLWPVFLDQFAHASHAEVGTLYFQDLKTHDGATEFVRGIDPSYDSSYRAYYAAKNIYLIRGQSLLRAGCVTCSEELCPMTEVLRSEFYNDWVNPQKLDSGLNGVFLRTGSLVGSLGAIRAHGAKPFGLEEKRLVQHLIPHLQRALRLRRHIAELEFLEVTTSYALDRWTTALFVVDRDARVIIANHSGTELIRQCDGLLVEGERLRAATARESVFLHHLIDDAIRGCISTNGQGNGAMLIERPSGRRSLHALVTPSINKMAFLGIGGHALVFVSDPDAEATQAEILQNLYGLTPAEAKVTELLASGESVKEIAETISVRENTVRIHLKRIFDKTATKRQAELVKLVLSGIAGVRGTQS